MEALKRSRNEISSSSEMEKIHPRNFNWFSYDSVDKQNFKHF